LRLKSTRLKSKAGRQGERVEHPECCRPEAARLAAREERDDRQAFFAVSFRIRRSFVEL
jgi:hypothetical protein